ncbi:hypothetical protein Scep_005963 [Stephania cephalantha]|uniref:AB hydrolase-1 domain-containing protein n=1 Tax=Stephania cephalantha TaxID=152367 RepID=A0AAP0PNI5_9MAGN
MVMAGWSTRTRRALRVTGNAMNRIMSVVVFLVLDVVDVILCVVYRLMDFLMEAQWKACYCSCSSAKQAITSGGKILLSENRGDYSKVLRLSSTTSSSSSSSSSSSNYNNNYKNKLQLDHISDTLYRRPSMARMLLEDLHQQINRVPSLINVNNKPSIINKQKKRINKTRSSTTTTSSSSSSSTLTINSTFIEMILGKIGRHNSPASPIPRWSDCDCKTCNSWSYSGKDTLFVHVQAGPTNKGGGGGGGDKEVVKVENVVFIHGFISSSEFWTETVFPNLSKPWYRLIAVDLLGFGRSPKPSSSLYTLGEHVDMIHRSVIQQYNLTSFHIVAHSLGCIIALAIAHRYPGSVKSLTLLAPPCFTMPDKCEINATQYVMRKIAPRRVWPLIAFGASLACWYEHVSRTICFLICKNHRLWEFLIKLFTRNRLRTFLVDGFCCHTHNAAWHTLHNIICGNAGKLDGYLDGIRDGRTTSTSCQVNVFHGRDDELVPVECSYALQSKLPDARVNVIDGKDHITIVVGRPKEFATELEEIWMRSSCHHHPPRVPQPQPPPP